VPDLGAGRGVEQEERDEKVGFCRNGDGDRHMRSPARVSTWGLDWETGVH